MIILAIRTDKPEAEIGLFDGNKKLAYQTWQAHRQLAETIHLKIDELLTSQNLTWHDIGGVVAYRGPGSFTGLRIGLSVANALASALQIPIVGATSDLWTSQGIEQLLANGNTPVVMPEYGAPVHITPPNH